MLESAASVLSLNDWIGWKLTGQTATDRSQAGESLLCDDDGGWDWDLIDRLSLSGDIFPDVKGAGEPLGELTAAAAAELGLRPGTLVAVGGADTQCGLLGSGVVAPGQLGIVAGSTAPLQLVLGEPRDCAGRLWVGRHVVPGRWVLESNAGAMGDTLDWLAGVLYPEARRPVARLLTASAGTAAGAGGVVSSLGARIMDGTDMMSMPVGSVSLTHLDALGGCDADDDGYRPGRHGRWAVAQADRARRSRHGADLSRAVLEGMAFAVRANAWQLLEAAAVSPGLPDYRLGGGLARSPHFAQLVCDVLDAPLHVAHTGDATLTGAAVCAGVAAGVFADLDEGVRALARLRLIEPDERTVAGYQELYSDWERWRRLCTEADRAAAGMALRHQMEHAGRIAAAAGRPLQSAGRPLRILVTAELDDVALDMLGELGEVSYESYREALRLLTGDELVEALTGFDVLVAEVDILDSAALVRCRDLRVVAACRGRPVNIDVAACTALGIPVLYAPGRNGEAVADLTLTFMLMLARKMPQATAFLRVSGAEAGDLGRMGQAHADLRGRELGGWVVGLIGLGAAGCAVARRLQAFDARVLVYDPHVTTDDVRSLDAEPVALDDLLARADIVSLHAAVTDETRGLMDGVRLARMKRGAFLVNTARAALVDEPALLDALSRGHLGGAALDVFAQEPPGADHPLLALPTVIATPHLGGNTVDVAGHQGRVIAADLRLLYHGRRPRHILNTETLDGFSWVGERPALDSAAFARLGAGPRPVVSDVQGPAAASVDSAAAEECETVAARGSGAAPAAVLRRFLEGAEGDAALRRFAARHTVRSHYVVSDLGLEFHIEFVDGRVEAGLGPPARPADAGLKARAEILDAIFSGSLSGNRAAMTGRLSFSGDVRLAMGMQRVQKDLIRLYTAAREECGGLRLEAAAERSAAALSGPPAAETAVVSVEPTTAAGREVAACSEGGREARAELASVADELFAAGLITATGGNVSVRISGTDEVCITPSQLFKGRLRPEMMVRVGL
ncbi:MAG: SCP2 sterol-binding domain-containing protein, partial [Actinobacteria bacterium]|nr:SCP2 sterol-binding domain-containing protein [Actinomycetota bacterium]